MTHETALHMTQIHAVGRTPDREPWMELALCAQTDPELFFPDQGASVRPAKAICAECEVRAQCLAYALGRNIHDGIWGGLTARERRDLRREAS